MNLVTDAEWQQRLDFETQKWRSAQAEVERLRSQLREQRDLHTLRANAEATLQAEVERLRGELEAWRFNFNEAQAAKERVNARLRRIEEAAREVLELHGDNIPDLDWPEMKALRAALEEK